MSYNTKGILALLLVVVIIASAALAISPWRPWKIVDAGERGVMMHLGEVQDKVYGEGPVVFVPFFNKVKIIDVKQKTLEIKNDAFSSDIQETTTMVVTNYRIYPPTANKFHQEIGYACSRKNGCAYEKEIMTPVILDIVKATTAKFEATQLIDNRTEVKKLIEANIKAELKKKGIDVITVSLTNFKFGDKFTESIEEKVVARELTKKASIDLERIGIEAQQKFAKAEGDAKAIEVIQKQLEVSDSYIEYLKVTNWNGELSKVTGGATPFMDVSAITGTAATG